MLKFRSFFLLLLLLLVGCGPFDVSIEPLTSPTGIKTPSPSALPAIIISTTPLPGTRLVTPTVTHTFTATPPTPPTPAASTPAVTATAPEMHLKAGTPIKVVQTHMLTNQTGWGIGDSDLDPVQHILFTQDGGRTWKDLTPQRVFPEVPPGGLVAVAHFASADNAWVTYSARTPNAGDQQNLVVWRTSDGGKNWSASQPLDFSGIDMEFKIPSDLGFVDAQKGWLMVHLGVGMSHDYMAVFTSSDGGQTWQRVVDPDNQPGMMGCVKSGLTFTSPSSGWITGNCPGLMPKLFLYHSSDGGVSWTEASLPVPPGKPANYFAGEIGCGITALNAVSARAMAMTLTCTNYSNNSAQAWQYASGDAGQTWSARLLPVPYTRIDLVSPTEGFLVGSLKPGQDQTGVVYHTTNGGADWQMATTTGWTGLPDFVDSQNGWVVATFGQVVALVRSTDGGRNWVELKPVIGK